jgi:prepilin-type N-terminal cleavage/methylation domain-containing protein
MPLRHRQAGVTLVEMMVVIILASIVILGMTTFYFNAQTVWLDGSSQAITQREATLVVQTMRDSLHRAADAIVDQPDQLVLVDENDNPFYAFWVGSDSLLHGGPAIDNGAALIRSRVSRFEVMDLDSLVQLTVLQLQTGTGQTVQTSSRFGMLNR